MKCTWSTCAQCSSLPPLPFQYTKVWCSCDELQGHHLASVAYYTCHMYNILDEVFFPYLFVRPDTKPLQQQQQQQQQQQGVVFKTTLGHGMSGLYYVAMAAVEVLEC